MIKAIFFDSGDVLVKLGFASGIREYEEKYSLPNGRLYAAAHDRPYWRDFTLGKITEDDYLGHIAQDLDHNFDKEEFKRLIVEKFASNEDLIAYIRTLKPKHILGIISNNPKEWFEYFFAEFGWAQVFDVKAVSGYLHVRKPDVRIFEYALGQAGVKGSEAVYIDNRPERVEGGENLGMKILIYKDNQQIRHELSSLLNNR